MSTTPSQYFTVSCDGGAAPNPGLGGWAFICMEGTLATTDEVPETLLAERAGAVGYATNNQMELRAAIEGLRDASLPDGAHITLIQDSQYVLKGLTEWMPGWKKKNWRTSDGKPVKNQELWQELDSVRKRFASVKPQWVRGHEGHPLNEHVDTLVNKVRDAFQEESA